MEDLIEAAGLGRLDTRTVRARESIKNLKTALADLLVPVIAASVPERKCGRCGKPAVYVAADGTGLEWFECGEHDKRDNIAGVLRTSLITLELWWAQARTTAILR